MAAVHTRTDCAAAAHATVRRCTPRPVAVRRPTTERRRLRLRLRLLVVGMLQLWRRALLLLHGLLLQVRLRRRMCARFICCEHGRRCRRRRRLHVGALETGQMRVGSDGERRGLLLRLLRLRRLLSRWSQRGARRRSGWSLHRDEGRERRESECRCNHSHTHSLTH